MFWIEQNENKKYQNVRDAAKREILALNAHIILKKTSFKLIILSFLLYRLEKQERNKLRARREKELIKNKHQWIENRKFYWEIEKNGWNKKLALWKDQKIDKPLAKITEEKREEKQIINIRNKREDITIFYRYWKNNNRILWITIWKIDQRLPGNWSEWRVTEIK